MAQAAPKVASPTDGIFEIFRSHPLVALGEMHGLAQEYEVYFALVQDPRFAAEVGNIILETGSASKQAIVDRYVNGDHVPYTELRQVWADAVGATFTSIGSIRLYAAIREANAKLPPERRIKVWLGDPPIDWTKIKRNEDWAPLERQRDSHPADLARREILSKGKKALLIYGVGHFGVYPNPTIRTLINQSHPNSMFVIAPYVGYAQKDCAARFERHIKDWPVPSLIWPIKGSTLEGDIWRKGCSPFPQGNQTDAAFETTGRNNTGLTSHGLLYLGPRTSLLSDGTDPDILMDLDYRAETSRRMVIMDGEPMPRPSITKEAARPFLPD